MEAHDLVLIGSDTQAESLQLGAGAIIDFFDTDNTLAANSDTRVATQKAVKTYVDAAVPGTGNLIFQLNSKVEVTDTGTDGQIEIVTDGNQAALFKEADAETDYTVVLTNAGNGGGLLKLDLDGHNIGETYNAIELSNVSAVEFASYEYVNALWAKTQIAGATLVGNAIDIYGGEFATWTNGTGFYNAIYGGGHYADVRTNAQVEYITGHSTLARQQNACTKPSESLIASEHLAYVYGSGLVTEAKAEHNLIGVDASGQVTDLYGSWTQVAVTSGATVADIYLDRMQFTGTGGATGTIWGLYVEGAESNYIEGDLTITGDLFIDGTTFVVNNQEVTTSDNIIVVNNGEVGPGVTAGSAGIQVDRGSETDYQFLFVEASDTFRVGELGSLQAVATREDSPTDQAVPYWNDASKRYDTANARFKINGDIAEIYHSSTLAFQSSASGMQAKIEPFNILTSNAENGIRITANGAVSLYHNSLLTAATNAGGISVYDASGDDPIIRFNSSTPAEVGYIQVLDNDMVFSTSAEIHIKCNADSSVDLYYNGAVVAQTTAAGITGAVWG